MVRFFKTALVIRLSSVVFILTNWLSTNQRIVHLVKSKSLSPLPRPKIRQRKTCIMSDVKSLMKTVEKHEARVFEMMEPMEHEQVMFFNDKPTGLKGIIAVHNTVLGPSLGGCRI